MFIDLTVARTGAELGVNVSTIIDYEGVDYASARKGAPNLTYHPKDPDHNYPNGHGSFVTIRGRRKEDNPVLVEQSPEDIRGLLNQEGA